jgi:hypothetical protein
MDAIQMSAIILTALAVGSLVGTWLMVRYPGTRAWIRDQAFQGYNYLDNIKGEVPPELMPVWQCAYDELDAVVDAFGDDNLTMKEVREMAYHAVMLVKELRAAFGV